MTSKLFFRLAMGRATGRIAHHAARHAALALLIPVAGVTVLTGCSTYNGVTRDIAEHITPYRVTIVQGNFVSQEAAAKLHVGMTRAQVRTTLGTPLLTDMFHTNRWDYIFYFKRGSTAVVQQRDLILHFSGDQLASWSGAEDLPSEYELISEIDGDKHASTRYAQERQAAAAAAAASAAAAGAPASGVTAPQAASGAAAGPSSEPANAAAAKAANAATSAPLPLVAPSSGAAPVPNTPGLAGGANGQSQFHLPTPGAQSHGGTTSGDASGTGE